MEEKGASDTEASLAAATAAATALGGTHMVESSDCALAGPTAAPDLEGAPLAGRSLAATSRYLESVGGLHDGCIGCCTPVWVATLLLMLQRRVGIPFLFWPTQKTGHGLLFSNPYSDADS